MSSAWPTADSWQWRPRNIFIFYCRPRQRRPLTLLGIQAGAQVSLPNVWGPPVGRDGLLWGIRHRLGGIASVGFTHVFAKMGRAAWDTLSSGEAMRVPDYLHDIRALGCSTIHFHWGIEN